MLKSVKVMFNFVQTCRLFPRINYTFGGPKFKSSEPVHRVFCFVIIRISNLVLFELENLGQFESVLVVPDPQAF